MLDHLASGCRHLSACPSLAVPVEIVATDRAEGHGDGSLTVVTPSRADLISIRRSGDVRKGGELNAQGTLLCSTAFEAAAVANRLALPCETSETAQQSTQ